MLSAITSYATAKGPKRWALWVYISLGVLAAGAAFYFWYSKKKREIIKLKAKEAQAHVNASNARYQLNTTKNKDEIKRLLKEASGYQKEAAELRKQIADDEQVIAVKLHEISELKSWKDIDDYNKQGRS